MNTSVLVVVLHYKGVDDTRECVASLGPQNGSFQHILVVENGRMDPLGPEFAVNFPWVEIVRLPENLGWSGGNNAGIRIAIDRGYGIVCLLNNDTVLPDGAMARLGEAAALLGPCLLNPAIDYYEAQEGVQFDAAIPQPVTLRAKPVPERPGIFEVDHVNGSCLMIHTALLESTGMIDDRFFLQREESDLCGRAAARGYRFYCCTTVRIRHKESRAFGARRTPIKTYYTIRNDLLYGEKHPHLTKGRIGQLRQLGWTLWWTADAAGERPESWWGLVSWSLSHSIFARAARMGFRDYIFRRFGRINWRDEQLLLQYQAPPASPKAGS